jgi:hypothetical protein
VAKEISKLPSIQGVGHILLVAFSQTYSENWEKKIRAERFEKT